MIDRLRACVFTISVVVLASLVVQGSTQADPIDTGSLPDRSAVPAPATGPPHTAADASRPTTKFVSGIVLSTRTRSALLARVVPPRRALPTSIAIDALGASAPVAAVGTRPDGQLDVPPDPATVAWYGSGVAPGEAGSAVLAGHVDWNGVLGTFFSLSKLDPGAVVRIGFDDGTSRSFRVVARRQYAKPDLPTAELFTTGGPPQLVLVTCGGSFDRATRHYRDNVVVVAVPVA